MRLLRRIVLWGLALLLLPLLLAGGVAAWFVYLAGEETWTAALTTATDAASSDELGISAEGFRRDDAGTIRLRTLTLADAKGPWLQVSGVAVDLHAARLIGREVHLENVEADRIEVLRAPISDAPPAEPEPLALPEKIELPQLPVALRLDRLNVGEIVLAEGLAPETTRIALDGAVAVTGEGARLRLDTGPLDLGRSFLKLDAAVDAATGEVRAALDADLPLIAPLAEALQAPPDGRLTLSLAGQGTLADSVFSLGVTVDGIADLVGDLKLGVTGAQSARAELSAFVSLNGGALAEPAAMLGQTIDIAIAAELPSPDRALIPKFSIQSQHLTIDGNAEADLNDTAIKTGLTARFRNHEGLAALLQGGDFEELTLTLKAEGPPEALDAELRAELAKPSFDSFGGEAVTLDVNARAEGERATGNLRVTVTGIRTGDPDLDLLAGEEPALTTAFAASAEEVALRDITLSATVARAVGSLNLTPETGTLNGQLQIDAPDLTRIPQLAGLLSGGAAGVDIKLDGLSAGAGSLGATTRLSGLKWRDPALGGLAGSTVTLETAAEMKGEDIETVAALRAEPGLTLDSTARLSGDAIAASYRLRLPRLPSGLAPPDVQGLENITLTGKTEGSMASPSVTGRLTANDISAGGIRIASPTVDFAATDLAGSPGVDLRAGAVVMDSPFTLTARARADLAANRVGVPSLNIEWRTASVETEADINLNTTLATSQTGIRIENLADLSDLAGTPLEGSLDATMATVPNGGRLDATVEARGSGIAADAARLSELLVSLRISDLLAAAPGLDGSVEARAIQVQDARVETAVIGLSGDLQQPAADIRIDATAPEKATLTTALAVDLRDPTTQRITVSTLDLRAEKGRISARQPLQVLLQGETITLADMNLITGFGGEVRGGATYAPDRLFADLTIADLPLGPILKAAGMEGFSGTANADVRIDTRAVEDKAVIDVDLSGLTAPDVVSDTPFGVHLDARWRGASAVANAEISGPFRQPLTASFTGDLALPDGALFPEPAPDGNVTGSVDWDGRLETLLALLPEGDHLADGPAAIHVDVSGTWSDPRLAGTLHITGARYENLMSGTFLRDIGLAVDFQQDGSGRFTLSARGPENGAITGNGSVVLLGENQNADIAIRLQNLVAVRRDEARVMVSGDTRLTWDGQRILVHVRKVLDRVDVYLEAPNLPPSVVALELESEKPPPEPEAADEGPDLPVDLDIEVSSPGEFFVRGRGLESEWRGNLTVKGTASEPVIRSQFSAVRGTLALLGRDFRLDKGELGLDESFKPNFRIELVRETPDLTGRIIVSGDPAKPDLTFTSEPELPRDEVLPRIMFDKAKQSLSPLEAVTLAQGLQTLSNGKPGATDRIRNAVGLDVLRFEESSDPESAGAVSVGRYVRDGVYVGAKKSVDSEAGSVVVEIDLLPNVKVDAEVGQSGGGSTGITWEKKY